MHTTISNSSRNVFREWFLFLPVYLLLTGIAYHVSGSVFNKSVDSFKLFGFSFSKELVFNNLLFLHFCIAIGAISLLHFLSVLKKVHFNQGRKILALLLLVALFLFILGINLPLVRTTKFYFIKENYSLIEVLTSLKATNEILLYWVMLVFTFVVPMIKLAGFSVEIFLMKNGTHRNPVLGLISRWAMVDVLVVAVLISCLKSGNGLVEMTSDNGLIYFAASVIVSLIISTIMPVLLSSKQGSYH